MLISLLCLPVYEVLSADSQTDNEHTFSEISSVLQLRRGKRDNLGIIFHITALKCVVTHH